MSVMFILTAVDTAVIDHRREKVNAAGSLEDYYAVLLVY
jgi:hypothetical protein